MLSFPVCIAIAGVSLWGRLPWCCDIHLTPLYHLLHVSRVWIWISRACPLWETDLEQHLWCTSTVSVGSAGHATMAPTCFSVSSMPCHPLDLSDSRCVCSPARSIIGRTHYHFPPALPMCTSRQSQTQRYTFVLYRAHIETHPQCQPSRVADSSVYRQGEQRDATDWCDECMQGSLAEPADTAMSEDCLCLNVWAPSGASSSTTSRPVYVFIHGGGFISGASSVRWMVSDKLALAADAVVVTINYRLGPLGDSPSL
jgi:hypothetical protein